MSKKVFWLAFVWSASLSIFSQFFVLPVFFPEWGASNGLISPDAQGFHRVASELVRAMHTDGWSRWVLRPQGQAPAGIAAAIYYWTLPQPWVMIPLNAAIHAFSALVFFLMIRGISGSNDVSLWAVLPFVFFPSAMIWYAQLHKDGIFILGNFLFLYAWTLVFQTRQPVIPKFSNAALVIVAIGCYLVAIVRPYFLEVLVFISFFFMLFAFFRLNSIGVPVRRLRTVVLSFASFVVGVLVSMQNSSFETLLWYEEGQELVTAPSVTAPSVTAPSVTAPLVTAPIVGEETRAVSAQMPEQLAWVESDWLPSLLDQKLERLSRARDGFLSVSGNSNYDEHISFNSANDVFRYLPKALAVALLAPFPRHWVEDGSSQSTTIMRRVTGVEMVLSYVFLSGLLLTLYLWRALPEFWVIIIFGVMGVLVFALTVPNLGTLYRMRYGFLMLLISIGLAGILSFIRRKIPT